MTPFPKSVQLARPSKPAKLKEYKQATERARTAEGYLRCERCGRSLLDWQAQRHHKKGRIGRDAHRAERLGLLCLACHLAEHHLKLIVGGSK